MCAFSLGEIYVKILRSAINLDLGVNSLYNILSSAELMRETLQPTLDYISDLNTTRHPFSKHTNEIIHNMTWYGLPLDEPYPVQFLAQYLCNGMTWKSSSNLVLDVLVATVSLFMAYWSILNFVLRQLAIASSPYGESFYFSYNIGMIDTHAHLQVTIACVRIATSCRSTCPLCQNFASASRRRAKMFTSLCLLAPKLRPRFCFLG